MLSNVIQNANQADCLLSINSLQFLDFAEAVREGRSPAVDGREGRKSVALIEAIYRSGRERRPVAMNELGSG